jgi:hypothetical protein
VNYAHVFTVDYRGLNEIKLRKLKNRCPLPLLDNMIDQLRGSTIFTKIDLRGAYNLLSVVDTDTLNIRSCLLA